MEKLSDNNIFPKYIKILTPHSQNGMVRLYAKGNKATYFRPCGEWRGELIYRDGNYYMPVIDHTNSGKPVKIREISAREFLIQNPYGYSKCTRNTFETAIANSGLNGLSIKTEHDIYGKEVIYHTLSR